MPRTSFDSLSKLVKAGEVPAAVYLFGEEDVLKEEALKAIADRVVDPGLRDFNYDQRSAGQVDAEAIETLCNTLPMMSERRLVVIREIEAWNKRAKPKAALLRYLEKPARETVLVLVQSAPRREDDKAEPDPDLLRLTVAVEVERYAPRVAEKWVQKRAEERGIVLEPGAAAHLVKAVDGDLGAARTELDKLAGLGGEAAVTVEQLGASLGVRHGETPTDWCDAVLEDRTTRAATVLPHLLAQTGVTGVNLLMQLGTQLIGLGLARARFDRGARGAALERGIFEGLLRARPPRLDYRGSAARWGRLVEAWPRRRIRAAIAAARRADLRLKSTTLSGERGILVDFIMELAYRAREAA